MWKIAVAQEPNIVLLLPKDLNSGVKCRDYGAGCIGGVRVRLRKVDLTLVEFETKEHAKNVAARINQYYVRNWVFDNAMKEPVLEHFIKKTYNAQRGLPLKKRGN